MIKTKTDKAIEKKRSFVSSIYVILNPFFQIYSLNSKIITYKHFLKSDNNQTNAKT